MRWLELYFVSGSVPPPPVFSSVCHALLPLKCHSVLWNHHFPKRIQIQPSYFRRTEGEVALCFDSVISLFLFRSNDTHHSEPAESAIECVRWFGLYVTCPTSGWSLCRFHPEDRTRQILQEHLLHY